MLSLLDGLGGNEMFFFFLPRPLPASHASLFHTSSFYHHHHHFQKQNVFPITPQCKIVQNSFSVREYFCYLSFIGRKLNRDGHYQRERCHKSQVQW